MLVYVELYADAHGEDCGAVKENIEYHVVGTTEDDRKLKLAVDPSAVPADGSARASFLASPPVASDVTGAMGQSCGAWSYVRDL